jgi:hypothetical protein
MKTIKNNASVSGFLNAVEDNERRKDAKMLLKMMKEATGDKPHMWGDSIIGFGEYSYTRSNGQEFEWFQIGFSPRKNALSLYFMPGHDAHKKLLDQLGKHKTGAGCLYITRLSEVDLDVLQQVMGAAVAVARK